MFYRAIELPSDEPIQYVGVYVLKWGKVDQPTIGFVEDETISGLLAALERVQERAKSPQNRGAMTQFQACRFLDDLLAEIEPALAAAHESGELRTPSRPSR